MFLPAGKDTARCMTDTQTPTTDSWTVAGRTFTSRLIVGTGQYKDLAQNAAAV